MKVDINQKLKGLEGKFLTEGDKDITLQDVLIAVSLTDLDKEGENKIKDFNLFMKIKPATKELLELSNEDCTRLQTKVKKTHSTIVVGQVDAILEGKPNPML